MAGPCSENWRRSTCGKYYSTDVGEQRLETNRLRPFEQISLRQCAARTEVDFIPKPKDENEDNLCHGICLSANVYGYIRM